MYLTCLYNITHAFPHCILLCMEERASQDAKIANCYEWTCTSWNINLLFFFMKLQKAFIVNYLLRTYKLYKYTYMQSQENNGPYYNICCNGYYSWGEYLHSYTWQLLCHIYTYIHTYAECFIIKNNEWLGQSNCLFK